MAIAKYTEVLLALLPQGLLWDYARDPASIWYLLLDAMALEFQRVEDRALDLIEEADPRTTDELLDDWERIAGLPSTCYVPITDDERRTALHSHLSTRGGQHEQFYIDQATAVGYSVSITRNPYDIFVAGSLCGEAIWSTPWRFVFRVYAIEGSDDAQLMCVFRSWTQSHTAVGFWWVDITDWNAQTADGYTDHFYAAFSNEDLVVIGGENGEIQIAEQADITTWHSITVDGGYANTVQDIVWAEELGLWIFVGSGNEIQTSPDAANWTQRSAAAAGAIYSVNWDGSILCAVGVQGRIQTSPDGINWTQRTQDAGYVGTFRGVMYVSELDLWVICGDTGEIQTSPDAITWTRRVTPGAANLEEVDWNGTSFCSINGTTAYLSEDGINWRLVTISGPTNLVHASAGLGHFLAAGTSGDIYTSKDGETWTQQTPDGGYTGRFRAGTYAAGRWVLAGNDAEIQNTSRSEDLSA